MLIGNISGVHFQSLIPCDTGFNYLSIEIESQEEQASNRHQMVLREKSHNQCKTNPQESACTNVPQIPNTESSIRYIARAMNSHDIVPYPVGPMNNICPYCSALHCPNEPLNCYHNGKVSLPLLSRYPEELTR